MDTQTMSYVCPSNRNTSRVYQDLLATRRPIRHLSSLKTGGEIDDRAKMVSRSLDPRSKPSICIVGAGVSGLRCADVLIQEGFNVTILEARNRIGGRIDQGLLGWKGHLIDLGPNWIHGTDHNPILDLAKETNTQTHSFDENFNVFDEDGKLVENGGELNAEMWGIIVDAFKYSASYSSEIDKNESLYDFFKKKVPLRFPGKHEAEQRKIVLQICEMWGAFVGSKIETQSLKFFWLEECIDGENLFCAGTYKNILEKIAKPAKESANIILNAEVSMVASEDGKINVTTTDGRAREFDEIVMTTPLGWLQKNKHVFSSPLPKRLNDAIDNISYGTLEKVYLEFPEAFWLGNRQNPDKDPLTGFTQWLHPKYAKDTNRKLWCQEAVDLSTLPGSCAHPTLLFYIYGEQSVEFVEDFSKLPDQQKKDFLVEFFEPYYSRLPHYDEANGLCQPASCFMTSWVNDRLAGNGSYSCFRTGLEEGDKDIEIMREGLPDSRLWISGEHTSPFVALGTVTGAYWSGEAVARRILSAYGIKDESITAVEDIVSLDGPQKEVNVRGFADAL